jgi:hypothetical protein
MNKNNQTHLVTSKTLLLTSMIALIVAILLYFVVVLPAEYNKDPTGLGEKLGLTVLSQTEPQQMTNTDSISKDNTAILSNKKGFSYREDEQSITVPPQRGIEYKFNVLQFENLIYEWKTLDGSDIYFDFHGEPEGDTTGYFESYSIATTDQMKGTATVPFNGSHGWYWKNTTDRAITIVLKTSGNYLIIGLKK